MDKSKFIRTYLLLFILLLIINCEENPSSSNNDDPPIQTTIVSGQVILENQDEHSNCAIFDSMMTLLTGTDSSGFYEINFNSHFPDSSIKIKLFYFLFDYQVDSAEILLNDGFVVFDSLDVDELGNIRPINLIQLLDVTCTVSQDTVAIGDTIRFEADFKNVSDNKITLCLQISTSVGPIGIVKGPFEEKFGFGTPGDVMGEFDKWTIQPGNSYVGYHVSTIPDGKMHPVYYTFIPLTTGDYVMYSAFDILENKELFKGRHIGHIVESWDSFHLGSKPTTNLPLKIKAAKIYVKNN